MSEINEKELKSYFRSLCKSFYIVYTQVKRLEKEEEALEKTAPHDELEVINQLLQMPDEDEHWQKYVIQKYSKKELQEKKEELEQAVKEYNDENAKLSYVKREWGVHYKWMSKAIESVIYDLSNNELTVIVTSKEEIIALMSFFRKHEVSQYRVIDTEEKSLKVFSTGKKKYQEFYEAYCSEDEEKMKKVCRKYY